MKPGIAVMPFASITLPLVADGAPAATDTIFPPRTTIDPRSITAALGPMMRALVMVTSCACAGVSAANVKHASVVASSPIDGRVVIVISLGAWNPENST